MWQNIETAPKDGTRVLLWTSTDITSDDREYVAAIGGEHVVIAQIGSWREKGFDPPGWDLEQIGEPTHWMPLPEPPSDTPIPLPRRRAGDAGGGMGRR